MVWWLGSPRPRRWLGGANLEICINSPIEKQDNSGHAAKQLLFPYSLLFPALSSSSPIFKDLNNVINGVWAGLDL